MGILSIQDRVGEPGYLDTKDEFKATAVKGYPYYDYDNCRWKLTFIDKAKAGDYVIIGLGINDFYQSNSDIFECNGKKYINQIKKETNIPILTKIDANNIIHNYELKASIIYEMITSEQVTIFEQKNKPIVK